MIPGLEYEQPSAGGDPSSYPAGGNGAANAAASSPSAQSMSSVPVSPLASPVAAPSSDDRFRMQQLHRRRPHGVSGGDSFGNGGGGYGYGGTNGGAGPSPYPKDDDKYSKPSRAVRRLDLFPKAERDYTVRTERGGQLTAAGYVLMAILIAAEYLAWRGANGESLEHIVVDTSLGKRMRVNLNITFPNLHCNDVHLDVIDVAGDSQLEISDKMYKQRLNLDGLPRSRQKEQVEANVKAEEDKKRQEALKKQVPDDYCGPCYGAHTNEEDCCNTCDDVLAAYKKKRWNENAVQPLAEQCIREGRSKNEPKKMTRGEGCNLSGHFTVNRVAGNFHIAMGEGVDRDGRHIHQFLPEDRINFNASHVVHELSFMDEEYGDVLEGAAPTKKKKKKASNKLGINGEKSMNGVSKMVTEETGTTGLFQYFIKVVPTKYKGDAIDNLDAVLESMTGGTGDDRVLETNRYFYTERFRPLIGEVHEEAILSGEPDRGTAGAHVGGRTGGTLHEKMEHHDAQNAVLPGVFFVYEIYPFAVEVTQNGVPFMHLWTRVMATVGGVFTLMSLLDGMIYSREKSMKQGHRR
ncbi:hypothetical protein ACHAWF_005959 [Thalassiosira exigua]